MNDIAAFRQIVAGGFDAGCGIGSGNVKLGNSMLLKEGGKRLAGQGIAFCLCKDMLGYNRQLRHQFCAMRSGLEGPCSRRQVVMTNMLLLSAAQILTSAANHSALSLSAIQTRVLSVFHMAVSERTLHTIFPCSGKRCTCSRQSVGTVSQPDFVKIAREPE